LTKSRDENTRISRKAANAGINHFGKELFM